MNREEIISYLSEHKQEFANNFGIDQLALYGSYARNEQTDESDVDIAYTINPNRKFKLADFNELKKNLSSHFDKKVELVNLKYMEPFIKHYAQKDLINV